MHFRISSSSSFQRKTKPHVFLLLFVLTPVHLNWPSYASRKCYQSPQQLISTMKYWWLYITINSLTLFKWKMRNLRLNLIYLSFFVQYISLTFDSQHTLPCISCTCHFASQRWVIKHRTLLFLLSIYLKRFDVKSMYACYCLGAIKLHSFYHVFESLIPQ